LAKKELISDRGLLPANMERVKGGGILKFAERPTGVVFGVVLMTVGRSSPNIWPSWWVDWRYLT